MAVAVFIFIVLFSYISVNTALQSIASLTIPADILQQTCNQINYLGSQATTKIYCCITAAADNFICLSQANAANCFSGAPNPNLCSTCSAACEAFG